MIHRVVAVGRRDRTGLDTNQGVRAVDTLEIDVCKILGRGARARDDAGIVVAIRDSHARETTPQHFTGGCVEAMAVLDVVQLVLRAQRLVERDEILPAQNRSLAGLIEIEPAHVNYKADLNGLVQKIRLRKADA